MMMMKPLAIYLHMYIVVVAPEANAPQRVIYCSPRMLMRQKKKEQRSFAPTAAVAFEIHKSKDT